MKNKFVYNNEPYILKEHDNWIVDAIAPYCKFKNREFIMMSKKIFGTLIKDNTSVSIIKNTIARKYNIPENLISKVKLTHCRTVRDISLYIYDLEMHNKDAIEIIKKSFW